MPEYGTESVAEHVFALLLGPLPAARASRPPGARGPVAAPRGFLLLGDDALGTGRQADGDRRFRADRPPGGRAGPGLRHGGAGLRSRSAAQPPGPSDAQGFTWESLAGVFARADVVSLHCPLTEDNAAMVSRDLLATMKPTAVLINTARGGLIDESDLAAALNEGRIAGAALDVLSAEPIRTDNPLLAAKNCLITPHLAWASLEARRRLTAVTAANIAAFQAGRPIHVVN